MRKYDLDHIETQLKRRLAFPYNWQRVQNNVWDNATRFIYKTYNWDTLLNHISEALLKNNFEKNAFTQYAMNRWYNFWSAQAVEQLFTEMPGVAPNPKPLEDHYDFRWLGERFDHKTSVFPKGFEKMVTAAMLEKAGCDTVYAFAKAHPKQLIHWFYQNQSTGQRYHLKNRLFVVCYAEDGAHYKLKSEIGLFKTAVQDYIQNHTPADTFSLDLQPEQETLAAIIWVQ